MVAIGVKSATAPAVTSCEGDGETQASEDEDSEQMGGILGVDVVRDCGEASAGVGPLLGGKQGLARWVEAGLEACFEVGMIKGVWMTYVIRISIFVRSHQTAEL